MRAKGIRIFVLIVFMFMVVNALYQNNRGVVIEKEYISECSWIQLAFKNPTIKNGAQSATVVGALVPMHHQQEECWKVHITRGGKKESFCAEREIYDRVFVGDIYIPQHSDQEHPEAETRDLTAAERETYYKDRKKS